ncbi:MAG: hypothetical protein FJ206_07390 [Gemmatimonadetes bacterium]|nr:hypothetical protein [Gemmatimonadota bacterium]
MVTAAANFCHRCGNPIRHQPVRRNERAAWAIAAIASVAAVAAVGYLIMGGNQPGAPVASMGNAGNAQPGLANRAPDISSMSPRERFDRLFLRVAESQSSDTILMFAPMALGAYRQLDEVDTDARFHAAIVHLLVGEFAQAKALADTIARLEPTHLFSHVIRGEAAEQERDSLTLQASYRAFLAGYDAELRANRREYQEHQPILEQFRARATAK